MSLDIRRVLTCYYTARLYVLRCASLSGAGITLFTLIHDPINGKPDIIVLYQARDNAYAQISAHAQLAGCFFRLYW